MATHDDPNLEALRASHGFMVAGAALRSILAFQAANGWASALKEECVGVWAFRPRGCRGCFAVAEEVGLYLAAAAQGGLLSSEDNKPTLSAQDSNKRIQRGRYSNKKKGRVR